MTETQHESATTDLSPTEVVAAVYAALISSDQDTLDAMCERYYADDIVVREPESLPWGGVYEGRELVTESSRGIASPDSPIDAANLTVHHLIGGAVAPRGTTQIVAAVTFPWRGTGTLERMSALEGFTVRDGQVAQIQVYLWDAHAGIASLG